METFTERGMKRISTEESVDFLKQVKEIVHEKEKLVKQLGYL